MGKKSKKSKAIVSDDTGIDIDSLRDEFESNTEWKLRRKFLESNADSLNIDRLVCLSRCFVNIAVYGCSYPQAVMREVQERSGGILEELETERKIEAKQSFSQSFVKAKSGH